MSVDTHIDLHIWNKEKPQVAEHSLAINATDDYHSAIAKFKDSLPSNLTAVPHTIDNDHEIQFVFSEGLVTLEQYDPASNDLKGTERSESILAAAATFAEGFTDNGSKERFIKTVRIRLNDEKSRHVEKLTTETVKSLELEPEPELPF